MIAITVNNEAFGVSVQHLITSEMAQETYPIQTSEEEFNRLRIQADLFLDDARAMLARIGYGSGWNVLDLCCGLGGITDALSAWVGSEGRVVGADLDVAKLDEARRWAACQGLSNVTFVEANAFDSGLPQHSFDLVHCRFALSVIENGIGILDHMLRLVRPGGVVFVEEVTTHTMHCVPSTEDWDTALALLRKTFQAVGADIDLGLLLRGILLDRGLDHVVIKPCMHALTAKDPMTMHLPLTLASMSETIVSQGLMEKDVLDGLVSRVTDHLSRPDTMTISYAMMQGVGRVRG